MTDDTVEGYVYLTLRQHHRATRQLVATKATNRHPNVVDADEVVVRVYVVVPKSAFAALDGGSVVVAEDAILPEVVEG